MLPPSPAHILRGHGAQLNVLSFSADNKRLYSGDSSGQVIITSTESLRSLASWKAHTNGILGIQEWSDELIITHGRDHKLHVWTRVLEPTSLAETAVTPALPLPSLKFSMDVNALNYCRFSLLPQCQGGSKDSNALIALPNLIESTFADVWAIPSVERLHAAIGKAGVTVGSGDGRGSDKTGIIMSLHLFQTPQAFASNHTQLFLLLAYENGSVSLVMHNEATEKSIEGRGWDRLWTVKSHVESVMAMTVRRDNMVAFTVSADHLLCRYGLQGDVLETDRSAVHRTKYPGNGAISIRDDGRIVAVGGWDGKVRLYSAKTFKSLGTLEYHKEGCNAVAFASNAYNVEKLRGFEDKVDYLDGEELEVRSRWLATGGKDGRVAVWKLMDFLRK